MASAILPFAHRQWKLPQFVTALLGFIHTHSMPLIEHWWGWWDPPFSWLLCPTISCFILYFGIKLCIDANRIVATNLIVSSSKQSNFRSLRCINWVHRTHSHALIKHWMGCTSPFSSGHYLKQKHQKYRHNLHKGVFALIALSSNSQISFQKSISLRNLLRIAEQRKSIE